MKKFVFSGFMLVFVLVFSFAQDAKTMQSAIVGDFRVLSYKYDGKDITNQAGTGRFIIAYSKNGYGDLFKMSIGISKKGQNYDPKGTKLIEFVLTETSTLVAELYSPLIKAEVMQTASFVSVLINGTKQDNCFTNFKNIKINNGNVNNQYLLEVLIQKDGREIKLYEILIEVQGELQGYGQ